MVSTKEGFSQHSKEFLSQFEKSYKNKEITSIKPLLSDSLMVGIYSNPEASRLVEGIITKYMELEKLELIKEKKSKKTTELTVKCQFKNEPIINSTIILDKNDKIVRFKFFDEIYGINVNGQASKLVVTLPFEFIDNRIVIKVKVNNYNKELKILFDTGADGMGLKKSVADSIDLKINEQKQTNVVGGKTSIELSKNNVLWFDTLRVDKQTIAIFPEMEGNVDGLLGGNLIRKFITEINFDKSVINLYNFGEMKYPKNGSFVPLTFQGIPSITCTGFLNNDKAFTGNYVFDTGAAYPIIFFGQYVKTANLMTNFDIKYRGQTYSMGHASETVNGIVKYINLGKWRINNFTGTLQQPLANQNSPFKQPNGSFGIDLIKRFNCYINIYNREYYLLPNNSYNKPF